MGLSENGEIFRGVRNKTFSEFIDFILNDCKSQPCNEHWQPQYIHCDFCEIKYDFIGHVETLENDLKYIAHINNLSSLLPNDENILHVHPSGTKRFHSPLGNKENKVIDSKRKNEKALDYFSMLNSSQLQGLYDMYKIDFKIFGYSEYPYVKHNNDS